MKLWILLPVVLCLALNPPLIVGQSPKNAKDTQQINLKMDLDKVLALPSLWELTPEKLEELCAEPGFKTPPQFKWLTQNRDGARFARKPYSNISIDLSLFGGQIAVDEMVIDFKNGKASSVNLSIFNRGDSGEITKEDFDARYKTMGRMLGETLKVVPKERRPTAQTAVKTTGWLWTAPNTLALLEFNADAKESRGKPEFLRLKLCPPSGKDQLLGIAAIGRGVTTLKPAELLKFVKKENGDVYVSDVPMVDQGAKGYCVVASCQRMFEYLHVQCDQHELAELVGSDAKRGTSTQEFAETLRKIGNRFKVQFKLLMAKHPKAGDPNVKQEKFVKIIQDHINQGLPLLWSLELGLYPEEPAIVMQKGGFHMRMIIGYNLAKDQIIFSDSWGAGHEMKRISIGNAYLATTHLFLVEPQARL